MGRSNISLVGNTTQGTNCGGGAEVFKCKAGGNNLQFRTISATGGSIQIYQVGDRILIGGGGGTGGTSYTFTNGLTKTGTTVFLGGTLLNDAQIDLATHNLNLINGNILLTSGNSLQWTDGAYITSNNINGVEIDGDLLLSSGSTICWSDGSYITSNNVNGVEIDDNLTVNGCLSILGLPIKTTETNILYINSIGKISSGVTSTGTITGGTNGLSVSDKNICLGGTLIANTTIGNGTCALSIKANQLNLTGVTGIYLSGTTHLKTIPAGGASTDVALTWDSGTTAIRKLPIITEWVSSLSELAYTGQKFSYPTQSVFQTDVGICSIIPNYIFISGICLSTVCTTVIITIPTNKTVLFNRAKLIMLCTAIPTSFAVSIGNNYSGLGVQCDYNNLATKQQICDVCANETYELCLFCGTCRQNAVSSNNGSIIYFNTLSGSTCSLKANLLIEGFLF